MSKRILAWTDEAWESYVYWQRQDRKTLRRINKLIKAAKNTPFDGIGKPEPLKENLSGARIEDSPVVEDDMRSPKGFPNGLGIPLGTICPKGLPSVARMRCVTSY